MDSLGVGTDEHFMASILIGFHMKSIVGISWLPALQPLTAKASRRILFRVRVPTRNIGVRSVDAEASTCGLRTAHLDRATQHCATGMLQQTMEYDSMVAPAALESHVELVQSPSAADDALPQT